MKGLRDADRAQQYRLLLQTGVLIEAYMERFGLRPSTVGDLRAAIDAGLLDNVPRKGGSGVDVAAWERLHGR